jgi:predicted RNA-binding protein with PIN domain
LRFTTEELHYPNTFPTVTPRDVPVVFDAEHLHDSEKRYINQWIDFVFVLISEEVSVLATQKFIAQLKTGVRADIIQALSQFLSLFFFQLQITPTPAIRSYAKFIVEQMEKKLHQIYVTDIDTGEKVRL